MKLKDLNNIRTEYNKIIENNKTIENNIKIEDEKWMRVAIMEAEKGLGGVNPNPLVGAVIVKNGEVIGKGYHQKYGEPHAEVNAVNSVNSVNSQEKSIEGATVYVTLEPCSHFGKTPPCADMLVSKKIKRCVIGCLDPNEKVAGRGIKKLLDAGIEVVVGVLEEECKFQNRVFLKYITTGIPYIFLKCAITLDGKIATKTGSSKWITGEKAREKVQEYRNRFTGIMVGKNTVINDNPGLRTKISGARDPFRIIFDSKLEIPKSYSVISENLDEKTIIISQYKFSEEISLDDSPEIIEKKKKYRELKERYKIEFILLKEENFSMLEVLKEIGKLKIDSILVEGGSEIISQFFKDKLIDSGEIFIAPKILGDSESIPFIKGFDIKNISDGIEFKNVKYNIYGNDIGVEFFF